MVTHTVDEQGGTVVTTHFAKWRQRLLDRPASAIAVSDAQPTPMTVFVLSGGALNGAAQVGMLEELYSRGITPDAVVGVSAGAINAVNLAFDPVNWHARIHHSWRAVAMNGIFQKSSSRAVWAILRQRVSLDPGTLLRAVIRDELPVERLEDCVIPVRIGTVVLSTGEMRWWAEGPAYELLLASCAIPGIFPPVLIDGQLHVDGGVCSPVPVVAAIDLNPTRLVVLDVSLTTDDQPVDVQDPSALTVLLRSFEAARRRVSAAELAALTPDIEVIYIRAGSTVGFGDASVARITALIDEGRLAARAVLDGLSPIPSAKSAERSLPTAARPPSRVPRRPLRVLAPARASIAIRSPRKTLKNT